MFGYGVAKGLEQVLRQCGDDLTRANIMKQAANLNFEIGIYLPGTRIKTSPTDFAPLEQLQMMRFKGESWAVVRAPDVGREELNAHPPICPERRGDAGSRSLTSRPPSPPAHPWPAASSAFFF